MPLVFSSLARHSTFSVPLLIPKPECSSHSEACVVLLVHLKIIIGHTCELYFFLKIERNETVVNIQSQIRDD